MDNLWYALAAAAVGLGFLAALLALAIFWFRSRADLRVREMEIRHRVLEKYSDSEAFLAFARSDEGRRLLLGVAEPASNWRTRLGLIQIGLLVLAIGIGARLSASKMPEGTEAWERLQKQDTATWGTLFVCAGIALTASGALSRWLDRR